MLRQISFDPDRQVYSYDISDQHGQRVGFAQLRLKASKSAGMPEGFESHVYYEVAGPYQQKGYATNALKDLLQKAAHFGLKTVTVTVDVNNLPSIKVIEKNQGELVAEGTASAGQKVRKYELKTFGED